MKTILATAAVLAACGTATATSLELNLVNQIDLTATQDPASSSYIGANPATVAWDGTDLFVAGWNNGRGTVDHGIVGVANAASSDVLGTSFGLKETINFRGYNSLDLAADGRLVAAYDGGSADPEGLAIYDKSGALLDSRNLRPSFANWDPANNGGNAVGWTQFGSGRLSVADGSDLSTTLFDTATGAFIFAGSTIQRGLDIDDSGNIAVNDAGGNLTYFERTTPNGTGASATIASGLGTGDGNRNAIMNTPFGDVIIFNRRSGSTYGSSIDAADITGAPVSLTINGVDLSTATSTGWWDFDYNSATNTLAAVEFSTRQAFVFQVVPAPGAAGLLALGGFAATRRRR